MKRFQPVRVIFYAAIVFALAWLAVPAPFGWLAEQKLQRDCPADPPDDSCIPRLRGMGHYWSTRGELPRSIGWYERAAKAGDKNAMFHLAWVHEQLANSAKMREKNSAGGEKNRIYFDEMGKAITWYYKSADLGFAPAMNNLGQLYLRGTGRLEDPVEAFQWHSDAMQAGNPVGRWNLIHTYYGGERKKLNVPETEYITWWDPKETKQEDVESPTLERTVLAGKNLSDFYVRIVRRTMREGKPMQMKLAPAKRRDPAPQRSDDRNHKGS